MIKFFIYSFFFLLNLSVLAQQSTTLKNYTTEDGLPSNTVHFVYQDTVGYIWFSTDNGVSRYNGYEFDNYFLENTFIDHAIISIQEDDTGRLYFLSDKNNVFYFLNEKIHHTTDPGKQYLFKEDSNSSGYTSIKDIQAVSFLHSKTVTSSFKDHENSYWVTTLNNGVFYYANHSYIKNVLSTDSIYGLSTYHTDIALGYTTTSSLYKSSIINIASRPILKGNKGIQFIDDKLYYNEDLIYAENGAFINASKITKPLFIKKHKTFIYFIGQENRIYKVTPSTKTYQTVITKEVGKPISLGFDVSDNLWVGTTKGLFQIKEGQVIRDNSINTINEQEITAITHSKKYDLIYITKQNGIIFKTKDSVFSLDAHIPIKRSQTHDLYVDKNDDIWVLTHQGLFKISSKNLQSIVCFNKKNGLLSSDIRSLKILDKKAYVVTTKGLSIIDLQDPSLSKNDSRIVYQYIRLNNDKFYFPNEHIKVDPSISYLTINFVLLNYKSQGNIHYKYKIAGIHDDWVYTQNRKVQFTVLPSNGNYLFEVMAQDETGNWSDPHQLHMEFLIPFYRTWWFITLSILSFLLIFWGILRAFYKRKLNIQSLRTELLQLEGKALQSQMNPHFVFNALNSIQSFITTGDTLNSEIYLAKFSGLLRKTLNYSRHNTIELSKELESLHMYIELEKMRFGDKLSYQVIVDDTVETDLIKILPMLIQPFVENAIIHGISPKKGSGNISLSFSIKEQDDDNLYVVITDNGVGRKKKKNSGHKSLGTNIVKKRLSIVSSKIKERIIYTDLQNEEGQAIGTKVELIIPIYA